MTTKSAPIERRRSIKFYNFSAAHSGHFCYFYVQKYSNFGQKLSKMPIVYLICASWRSIQEWRSIGADTVCLEPGSAG